MISFCFSFTYLEFYLIIINIIAVTVYGFDKLQAVRFKSTSRVSEKKLLFITFIGGGIGALIAMILFKHKINKSSFLVKYIIVVLINITVIYYLSNHI